MPSSSIQDSEFLKVNVLALQIQPLFLKIDYKEVH
jgi:hypothetical protein